MTFWGTVEFDGNPVLVHGAFGAIEFFRSLRSIDSTDGTAFMNSNGKVEFFPDHLILRVLMSGSWPTRDRKTNAPELNPQLMIGLKFKACWKRGMSLRSVKEFRQLTVSRTEVPDILQPFAWPTLRQFWSYEFAVDETKVPLSEHFIFYIVSPDDKQLARMSAYI